MSVLQGHQTVAKRNDYLNWQDYFMAIACLTAKRTKAANDKAGACIVNKQNKIIGIGYNGMPNGIDEELASLRIDGQQNSIVHAELNAILNCTLTDQSGCSMYVSRYPCHDCAKAIIQSGIRTVYYTAATSDARNRGNCEDDDDTNGTTSTSTTITSKQSSRAADLMFRMVGVRCRAMPLAVDLSTFISQILNIRLDDIHLNCDDFFMSVAMLAAQRSKDPSTQVGACIVNEQNKIVATGYNGMPNGVHDDLVPWTKEGLFLETKYAFVVHAELNAILNCILTNQENCRLYVSLFPCNECAKAIIQSGIRHIVYQSDKHSNKNSTKAAKIMFNFAGVKYEQRRLKQQDSSLGSRFRSAIAFELQTTRKTTTTTPVQ